MGMRRFVVPVTTAADGTATVFSPFLSGQVMHITYVKANYTDGVDFTITTEATGQTVWAQLNVNTSVTVYPRVATVTTAGVAALYAAGGVAVNDRIAIGRDRIIIVLAQGGNATTGVFHIVMMED